jgi:hypothetical protein
MFSKSALLRTLILLFALSVTSRIEGVELTEGTVSRTDFFSPTTFSLSGPALSYSGSFDSYWWHWLPPCTPCFPGELDSTSNSFVLDTTDFYSAAVTIGGQWYYNWGSFYNPPPPYAIFSSSMNFSGGFVEVPLSDEPELILIAPFTMTGSVGGHNQSSRFGAGFDASGYVSLYLKRIVWSGRPAYMYQTITYRIATGVDIDVKPGEAPNYINLSSQGKTPIAILSTAAFDATTVNPLTVRVAGAPIGLRRNGTTASSLEDVNGDGLLDLVVHVSTEALQPTSPNQVFLEAYTISGERLWGTDEITLDP